MSIERLNIAGLIVPESGGAQTMVEFDLTDEQRLLQKTAHEFAEREMRPVALEYDKKGTVPWDVIKKAHALGSTRPSSPRHTAAAASIRPSPTWSSTKS